MVSPPVLLFLVSSSHVPLKSGFAVDLVFCAATIAHKKRMEVKIMGADTIDFRMMVFWSLLKSAGPINDHCNRSDSTVPGWHIYQKTLAVRSNYIAIRRSVVANLRNEQRFRCTHLDGRSRFDFEGHQCLIRSHIKQLLTVSVPMRLPTASIRHKPLAAGLRKGLDINLKASC